MYVYLSVHTLHYITLHDITLHCITLHYITCIVAYLDTYIHTYILTHTQTHTHIYIYIYVCIYIYICINIHIYLYKYIYINKKISCVYGAMMFFSCFNHKSTPIPGMSWRLVSRVPCSAGVVGRPLLRTMGS